MQIPVFIVCSLLFVLVANPVLLYAFASDIDIEIARMIQRGERAISGKKRVALIRERDMSHIS